MDEAENIVVKFKPKKTITIRTKSIKIQRPKIRPVITDKCK